MSHNRIVSASNSHSQGRKTRARALERTNDSKTDLGIVICGMFIHAGTFHVGEALDDDAVADKLAPDGGHDEVEVAKWSQGGGLVDEAAVPPESVPDRILEPRRDLVNFILPFLTENM